jgi:hypothetical protein
MRQRYSTIAAIAIGAFLVALAVVFALIQTW